MLEAGPSVTDGSAPAPVDPSLAPTPPVTAVSPQAATPTASVAGGSANSPIASVAQQVAPALLAISQGEDGVQRVTLRLHPADLGMVQVQIERTASGPASVAITADRAATLEMLQLDQPQLHRALDQAGVPAQGRTIIFHVAPVSPPVAAQAGPSQAGTPHPAASQSGGNSSSNGSQHNASGGSGNASGGGGSAGYAARNQSGQGGTRRSNTLSSQTTQRDEPAPVKWLRAGLDITA